MTDLPIRKGRLGWRPDTPDHRDLRYGVARPVPLPLSVDMRPDMPPVYDQGNLNSCTGHAIAAAVQYLRRKQNAPDFVPSRLFIYWNERVMENSVAADGGAEIRDGIKSISKIGVCSENDWPYDEAKVFEKPPAPCFDDAAYYVVGQYARVPQVIGQIKACLAAGHPIVFGFTTYESFEGDEIARTGILSMPGKTEAFSGGHAVLAVGYDDIQERILVRNSWGASWGQSGYFWMPYAYITDNNLADDLWAITSIGISS